MESRQPLLSICIPTYNRPDVLKECLDSIIHNEAFDDDVEVVVSDNATPGDEVEKVMNLYLECSNVHFYKNTQNIGGEANFIRVLSLGHGKFLKLHNDYSIFTTNGLSNLKKCVHDHLKKNVALYFHNIGEKLCYQYCPSIDDVILSENWGMSWIGSYGFWNEEWNRLKEKDKCSKLLFQQVDWFLRLFPLNGGCVICKAQFTERHNFKAKQGGYNFIQVHTRNFFSIFEPYVKAKIIKKKTLVRLKRRVLVDMLFWIHRLKNDKSKLYSYEYSHSYRILFDQYKQYWWFYAILVYYKLKNKLFTK